VISLLSVLGLCLHLLVCFCLLVGCLCRCLGVMYSWFLCCWCLLFAGIVYCVIVLGLVFSLCVVAYNSVGDFLLKVFHYFVVCVMRLFVADLFICVSW